MDRLLADFFIRYVDPADPRLGCGGLLIGESERLQFAGDLLQSGRIGAGHGFLLEGLHFLHDLVQRLGLNSPGIPWNGGKENDNEPDEEHQYNFLFGFAGQMSLQAPIFPSKHREGV
jgi:hypothetical protein